MTEFSESQDVCVIGLGNMGSALGVDTAVPTMVASYLDRAIAEGHGRQELAAIFELMVKKAA